MAERSLLDEFTIIEEYIDMNYKKDKVLKKLVSNLKNRLYQPNTAKTDASTNNQFLKDMPGALQNRESVCYMNALIQALASSNIMLKKLQELSVRYPSNASLSLLLVLLDNVNGNKESIRSNSDFLRQLVEHMKWTKPSQQDAFDLLATFIEQIEKEFPNDKKDYDLPLKIKILHEFQDKESPNTIQKYLGLSLNLCGDYKKSGVPLGHMIHKHFDYSEIDNNQNKLTRMSLYEKPPDVLLIHIQANKFNPTTCKLYKPKYSIIYEEDMTLYFHIVSSKKGGDPNLKNDREYNTEVKYTLKALIEHFGEISCGHFVTNRKWNDKWYLMNDENARPIQFDTKKCPYIMIYERSGSQTDKDSKDCNETDNDRKDGNQTDNDRKYGNQTDNDRKGGNQTDSDQKGGKQTDNDQKGGNQTDSDRKGGNQTDSDQKGGNQTDNDRKGGNQTDSDQKGGNQTDSDQKGGNQTDTDQKGGNQTDTDRKGGNQTESDQKGGNQTDSDQKGGNQTDIDQKGGNQTDNDRKGGNQTDSDRKGVNQTYSDQKGGNQTDSDQKGGNQTDSDHKGGNQTDNDQKDGNQTN